MRKGLFITFEGPDGGGKTTQIQLAAELLRERGYEVVCTREPGGTVAAEKMRSLVLDPALHIGAEAETLLYLAARAEHMRELIAPALARGAVVLCDRFSDSTFVYQGYVRGLELSTLQKMNAFVTLGKKPDLTVLLDAEPKQLLVRREDRGVADRFELEGLAFQMQVRDGFLSLAAAEPERIKIIDALGTVESVQAKIKQVLQKFLD